MCHYASNRFVRGRHDGAVCRPAQCGDDQCSDRLDENRHRHHQCRVSRMLVAALAVWRYRAHRDGSQYIMGVSDVTYFRCQCDNQSGGKHCGHGHVYDPESSQFDVWIRGSRHPMDRRVFAQLRFRGPVRLSRELHQRSDYSWLVRPNVFRSEPATQRGN